MICILDEASFRAGLLQAAKVLRSTCARDVPDANQQRSIRPHDAIIGYKRFQTTDARTEMRLCRLTLNNDATRTVFTRRGL